MLDAIKPWIIPLFFGAFGVLMALLGIVQLWGDRMIPLGEQIVATPILLLIGASCVLVAYFIRPKK